MTHYLEHEGLTSQPPVSNSPRSDPCLLNEDVFGTGDRSPEQSSLGRKRSLLRKELAGALGMCMPLGHLPFLAPLVFAR